MSAEPSLAVWTIVVAAGSGARFGAPKQYLDLGGERIIDRTVRVAGACSAGVVVVVPSGDAADFVGPPGVAATAVDGGATRSQSVRAGLAAVPETATVVLVHDGARPLASAELYERVLAAVLAGADAVVPAVPVVDTVRQINGGVVDRDSLRAVQTPQGFRAASLRAAHAHAPDATDDATLVEAGGGKVVLVDGELTNRKITTPVDLEIARLLLQELSG